MSQVFSSSCSMLTASFCNAHRHQSPSVLVPALRTVGNIVTGDDLQTQVIINCGALGCLLHLLTTSQKKSIKKVSFMSEHLAVSGPDIHALKTCHNLPPCSLRICLRSEQEACWTISNITAGTKEQIQSVVDAEILPPLVHLLGTAGETM